MTTDTLTLTRPDDWHIHLRDGEGLRAIVADTARQFGRAIVMPNLKPPVTTVKQALEYRLRIMQALAAQSDQSSEVLLRLRQAAARAAHE